MATPQDALVHIAERAITAIAERSEVVTLDGVDVVGVQVVVEQGVQRHYFRITQWDSSEKVLTLEPMPEVRVLA